MNKGVPNLRSWLVANKFEKVKVWNIMNVFVRVSTTRWWVVSSLVWLNPVLGLVSTNSTASTSRFFPSLLNNCWLFEMPNFRRWMLPRKHILSFNVLIIVVIPGPFSHCPAADYHSVCQKRSCKIFFSHLRVLFLFIWFLRLSHQIGNDMHLPPMIATIANLLPT